MTDNCKFITDFLNCDYELFENEKSGDKIINRWNDLAAQGKQEGFFPLLFVGSDDVLAESLELALEDADLENTPDDIAAFRAAVLREAETIDGRAFLAERLAVQMETYGEKISGEFQESEPDECFCAHMEGDTPYAELVIAKIPAKHPWELAAWLPMGGFNECPTPAQQVAVFKYWYEKYGAIPGVATHDEWEMELTKPPVTDTEAEELAKEHFAFCEDCVVQASQDTVRARASALKGSTTWYFWWD